VGWGCLVCFSCSLCSSSCSARRLRCRGAAGYCPAEAAAEAACYEGLSYLADAYGGFLDSDRDDHAAHQLSRATAEVIAGDMTKSVPNSPSAEEVTAILYGAIERFGAEDEDGLFQDVEQKLRTAFEAGAADGGGAMRRSFRALCETEASRIDSRTVSLFGAGRRIPLGGTGGFRGEAEQEHSVVGRHRPFSLGIEGPLDDQEGSVSRNARTACCSQCSCQPPRPFPSAKVGHEGRTGAPQNRLPVKRTKLPRG